MRTKQERILNLSRYENYAEKLIPSAGSQIALSIYESDRKNPCIIFIPGTMTHPLFYDDFLSKLAENKFNVIGIHPVSHGKSPRERKTYEFSTIVENAIDCISYCVQNFNKQILLMGSSQGGILATSVAAKDSRINAVFPHTILLPDDKDSIRVTNFPKGLKYLMPMIKSAMGMVARMFPRLQIPIDVYLDPRRVFANEELKKQFIHDPIGLTRYPLKFLSSLFSADLSGITDGRIKCPVVVILSKADPLFPFDYCQKIYEKLNSPTKEMLLFEEPHHLLFNECLGEVFHPILDKLKEYCYKE